MPFETLPPPPFPPVDTELVDRIVSMLKSQGIFDQFRKYCLSDVDTKPAYQNLQNRVHGSVASFLATQTWQQDLNRTQLRESLRRHVQQGFLEVGVDRIVDQVVNPKIITVFLPKVEDVVYNCLGIERPTNRPPFPAAINTAFISSVPPPAPAPVPITNNTNNTLKPTIDDLLPKGLDPVSPESDNLSMTDGTPTKDERHVNAASPKYEQEDSQLSGISDLSSHLGDSFKDNPADSNTLKSIDSPKGAPSELQFDNFTNLSEKIRQAEMSHGQVTDPHIDLKKEDPDMNTSDSAAPARSESSFNERKHENSILDEVKLETMSNNSLSTFEDSKNFVTNKFTREDTFTSFSEDSLASSSFSNKDKIINNIPKPSIDSESSNNRTEHEAKNIMVKEEESEKKSNDIQIEEDNLTKTDSKTTDGNKDSKKSDEKSRRDRDSSTSSKVSRSSDKHKSSDSKLRSSHDKKDEKDRKDDSRSSKDKGTHKDDKERSSSKDDRGRSRHKDDKHHSSKDKHRENDKSNERGKENDSSSKKTYKSESKDSSDKEKKSDKDHSAKDRVSKDNKHEKDRSGRSKHDPHDKHDRDKREKDRVDKDKKDKDKEKHDKDKEKHDKDREKNDKDRSKSEKEKDEHAKDKDKQSKEKSRHDRSKNEKEKDSKYEKDKPKNSDEKKDDKKKDSKRHEKSSHSSSSKKGDGHRSDDKDKKLKSNESSSRHKQNDEKSKNEDEKKDRKRKGERCNDEIKWKEARRSSDRDSSGGKGGTSHKTSSSQHKSASSHESVEKMNSEKKMKSSTTEGTNDSLEMEEQPTTTHDEPSEVEKIITQLNSSIEESQNTNCEKIPPVTDEPPVKKPKIANNIFEIRKIMQARKNIDRQLRLDLLKNRKEGSEEAANMQVCEQPLCPEPIGNANIPEENKENIKTHRMEKVKVPKNTSSKNKFLGFVDTEIDRSTQQFVRFIHSCQKLNVPNINEILDNYKNYSFDVDPNNTEIVNRQQNSTHDENEELLDNNLNNLKPKIKSLEKTELEYGPNKKTKIEENNLNGKVVATSLFSREAIMKLSTSPEAATQQECQLKILTNPNPNPELNPSPEKTGPKTINPEYAIRSEESCQTSVPLEQASESLTRILEPVQELPKFEQPSADSPMRKTIASIVDASVSFRPDTESGLDPQAIIDNLMKESLCLETDEYTADSDDSDYEEKVMDEKEAPEIKQENKTDTVECVMKENLSEGRLKSSCTFLDEKIEVIPLTLNIVPAEKPVYKLRQNLLPNSIPLNKVTGMPKEGPEEKVSRTNQRLSRSSQRYDSTDLYKPRPVLPQNSKRIRSSRSALSEDRQKMKSDQSDSHSKRRGR